MVAIISAPTSIVTPMRTQGPGAAMLRSSPVDSVQPSVPSQQPTTELSGEEPSRESRLGLASKKRHWGAPVDGVSGAAASLVVTPAA